MMNELNQKAARAAFEMYLGHSVQLSDVPGVRSTWGCHIDVTVWNVVYVHQGTGYDITLRRVAPSRLEIIEFIEAS